MESSKDAIKNQVSSLGHGQFPFKRYARWALLLMVFLVLLAGFSVIYLKNTGAPTYNGALTLASLESEVSIEFDHQGIPHIKAKSEKDAFKALGYITAQDRLFQMDILRRLAKGRLSEIFGEKAVEADKLFRTLRLYQQFQEDKGTLSHAQEVMDAYIEGVNAYVATGNKPFEYTLLGAEVEPFSREDCFGVLGYIAYSFAMGLKTDPLMESLALKFGSQRINELRREPLQGGGERVGVNFSFDAKSTWFVGHQFVAETIGLITGSNAWALNKERSIKGPILASDPHVAFGIPGLWYETHVSWEKGLVRDNFEFYGHFVPLLPLPAMAHTKNHAWGVTISYIDDMDFFWEEIKDNKYLSSDGQVDLRVIDETIKVQKAPAVSFKVSLTQTGPLIGHLLGKFELKSPELGENTETAISLIWGHHDKDNRPAQSFYKALVAKDQREFEEALSYGRSPGINVVYADKANNIGRYLFGTYWKRPTGDSGDRFRHRPRDKRSLAYYDNLPFEKRPHLVNPDSGIVVSANQKPENTPELDAGYFQPFDRYRTIHEILRAKDRWSSEELSFVQTSASNIYFGVYRDRILESFSSQGKEKITGKVKEALDVLKKWNLESPHDSAGVLLFYSFFNTFQRKLLQGMSDDEFNLYCDTNYLYHYSKRELLEGDHSRLIRESFMASVDRLVAKHGRPVDWKLSFEQTLTMPHPMSRASKVLAKVLNIGPFAIDGGYNQINNMRPVGCRDGMAVKAGPSTRRLVSLENPTESQGILPTGNSGHYASPFFSNQLELFLNKKYRPQLMRDLKEAEVYSKLILKP